MFPGSLARGQRAAVEMAWLPGSCARVAFAAGAVAGCWTAWQGSGGLNPAAVDEAHRSPFCGRATSARAWSLRRPGPGSAARRGSVQTRESWIAYPPQSAEDGVAMRLQIREESAACLAAEYWSKEPATRQNQVELHEKRQKRQPQPAPRGSWHQSGLNASSTPAFLPLPLGPASRPSATLCS
ncbi:LOW QUALITY PROTEIN: putative uncharacterized protein LRRC75A-AS1, mitochondrial [Piliocolobus tephrosceles]|uniref:LOW QUALITY PROTEIN: putative uncharacterized protein LRRC75A-AS1, mitochondrial n=1 Tax=Piliocolobus tephrosceles TaxID=591936 RepID=UPI000E6AE804|nr:LOW QUALITY PROTEIN: putative uncharacterized protein LRRC75A-AS1, mitochondrial [Piliocolobus tephrosceles]